MIEVQWGQYMNPLSFYALAFVTSLVSLIFYGFLLAIPGTGSWSISFPIIGDFGDLPPAISVFEFTISMAAIFWMIATTIRYLQLRALFRHNMFHDMTSRYFYKNELPERISHDLLLVNPHIQHYWLVFNELNGYNYCLAFCVTFSLFAYAAFTITFSIVYHDMFACTIALCTLVYCFIDQYISLITAHRISNNYRHNIRSVALFFMILAFFVIVLMITLITGRMGYLYFEPGIRKGLKPSNTPYIAHATLAICEYVFVFSLCAYFITIALDFKYLRIKALQTKYHFLDEQVPEEGRFSPDRLSPAMYRGLVAFQKAAAQQVTTSPSEIKRSVSRRRSRTTSTVNRSSSFQ